MADFQKLSENEVTVKKKWRATFGGFLENPQYFYTSLFLPVIILTRHYFYPPQ